MFVRWKKGKNKLYCYLCESKRVAGKPVTKTLGALGHYPDNASELERQQFWLEVNSNLEQFSLPSDEQEKIEAKIAEKVPHYFTKSVSQFFALEQFLDSFPDGVLLVATESRIIHQNQVAQSLLKHLLASDEPVNEVPQAIWDVCQAVMAQGEPFNKETSFAVERLTSVNSEGHIRIRCQWFQGLELTSPCFWVSLVMVHQHDDVSTAEKPSSKGTKVPAGNSKADSNWRRPRTPSVSYSMSPRSSQLGRDIQPIEHTAVASIVSLRSTATSAVENSLDLSASLILTAIEGASLGVVIFSQNGTVLYANKYANVLLGERAYTSSVALTNKLWTVCQNLIVHKESEQLGWSPSNYSMVSEEDISTEYRTIHVRSQWFRWDNSQNHSDNCFLITLEDQQQSLDSLASQEALSYGLTAREADVWSLKRRGYEYRDIASELFISENTVKKHLKNIYAKKEQANWSI